MQIAFKQVNVAYKILYVERKWKIFFHYKSHLCVGRKRANDQIFYLEKKIQTKKNFNIPIHMYFIFLQWKKKERKSVGSPPIISSTNEWMHEGICLSLFLILSIFFSSMCLQLQYKNCDLVRLWKYGMNMWRLNWGFVNSNICC